MSEEEKEAEYDQAFLQAIESLIESHKEGLSLEIAVKELA